MNLQISVAKTAGFCFGVKRAVEMAYALAAEKVPACTYGELIHNPQVVEELREKGLPPVDSLDSCTGKTVLLRSHGVPAHVYQELENRGCEVKGIISFCSGPYIVCNSRQNLENLVSYMEKNRTSRYILLAQTTFSVAEWQKYLEILEKVCTNLKIFDTICNATEKRQSEAQELAISNDLMLVVGGRHSSNTIKLAGVCEKYCKTFLLESPQELYGLPVSGYNKIGVTAGASTPARIIKEVHKTMSEIVKDQEELSFEEMLNQTFKTIDNREKVTAVVTGIAPNEISVDIGTKHAGYVPLNELTDDPNAKPEDLVKIGDELELMVVRVNDVEGTVMLSKKRLDAIAGFEKVMGAGDTGEILEGTVVEVIKGGLLALTNGVRVFIPASQATLSRSDSLDDLLKKKVEFKILEVNRQRKRAVGSIRAVLREQRKELEDQFWNDAEIGKKYTGTVKSLTSYGAFVNLGGVDGMIHISELSWSRIKHPSEVVNVGDTVEVYIRDIDHENKKISLGFKKAEENPWAIMSQKYQVGDVCKVKVVSLTPFGAFAQIIPGVDGLIHISQISMERINKPADALQIGQEVDAKITELDIDRKRVSLSIKALLNEQATEEQAAPAAEEGAGSDGE